ncbi:MAG TPA: hypothetical protein VG796_21290 [Verrucomicrobiales bacterium]|nr:hypothetical protein [Verrucomicrobiales bacterium]
MLGASGAAGLLALAVLKNTAQAQIPRSLASPLPSPPGLQSGAQLGSSVAIDGSYAVAGAHLDDTGALDTGIVKVFNASTGALLHIIPNPVPEKEAYFGYSVAISGTRVVVGAHQAAVNTPNGKVLYSGTVYIYDLASPSPATPVYTLKNPNPQAEDHFGWSVAISGTRVIVGSPYHHPDDSGEAYIYDLSGPAPSLPVTALTNPASVNKAGDHFGHAVAISGTTVTVGTPMDDWNGSGGGSAYVYILSGASPGVPVATLHKPAPGGNDGFGTSVGVSGTRVVIGAPFDNTGGSKGGSAWVYQISGPSPEVPVNTLRNPAPNAADDDAFGTSVSISGPRVLIGALKHDSGAPDSGSAYVFDLAGASPSVPVITLSNPEPGDLTLERFGSAVSLTDSRAIVGAPYDSTGAIASGSAYVYNLSGASPSVPAATLHHPGPSSEDAFGSAVALSGTRAVVGAWRRNDQVPGAGSAFVYDLAGSLPDTPILTLQKPAAEPGDYFGYAVAIAGTRVAVGSPHGPLTMGRGRVYVYDLTSATPAIPVTILTSPGNIDQFGASVAISGTRVAVGSIFGMGAVTASAWVYDLAGAAPLVPIAALGNGDVPPAPFACPVAISGTLVAAGDWGNHVSGKSSSGSVYIYDLTRPSPGVPALTINNPAPSDYAYFGFSVAISGTRVVAGVPEESSAALRSGAAYVFDLAGAAPATPVATLFNPAPAAADFFGTSVAISGPGVIVGAPGDDTGAADTGIAYVYDLAGPSPQTPAATLTNPSPIPDEQFGAAVAIDGSLAAIGAPQENSQSYHKGAVYLYRPALVDSDHDGLPDSWELTYWPDISTQTATTDSDHDGYPELLEYALGLNPGLQNPHSLPPVTAENGYLSLTLTKVPGILYEAQSSGDLNPNAFSPATTTILLDTATTLKVRDNFSVTSRPSRFLRLKVTAAP